MKEDLATLGDEEAALDRQLISHQMSALIMKIKINDKMNGDDTLNFAYTYLQSPHSLFLSKSFYANSQIFTYFIFIILMLFPVNNL